MGEPQAHLADSAGEAGTATPASRAPCVLDKPHAAMFGCGSAWPRLQTTLTSTTSERDRRNAGSTRLASTRHRLSSSRTFPFQTAQSTNAICAAAQHGGWRYKQRSAAQRSEHFQPHIFPGSPHPNCLNSYCSLTLRSTA
ncbi:hypothetical protein SVAN01_06363 [Stagonosporopsis vannaccii]|nr:hypothetical protein SVAN01_06363 [Stagonosporopsis vannaccii]